MKTIKATLLATCCASFMGLASCGPEETPEPTDYPINDFIFNTFLFAEGSWWAFYDSTTGDFDTITVTYSFGQHQNVYEGNTFKYSRYYYRADWIWSKTAKKYLIEYSSDQDFDWYGRKISQVGMHGYGNSYGTGYGNLYFDNMELFDTITAGFAYVFGDRVSGYFTLQQKGDILWYQNKWNTNPFVKFTLIKSVANDLKNVTMLFQEHHGLIEHDMDGNYVLVDQNLFPMLK